MKVTLLRQPGHAIPDNSSEVVESSDSGSDDNDDMSSSEERSLKHENSHSELQDRDSDKEKSQDDMCETS